MLFYAGHRKHGIVVADSVFGALAAHTITFAIIALQRLLRRERCSLLTVMNNILT